MTSQEGGLLPPQYRQVEYIEGTGEQWLDTGIYFDTRTDVFKMRFTIDLDCQQASIFGARTSGLVKNVSAHFNNRDSYSGGYLMTQTIQADFDNTAVPFRPNDPDLLRIIELEASGVRKSINRFINTNAIRSQFVTDYTLFIFWANGGVLGNVNKLRGRVYSASIGDKMQLVPCYRKADHKPGMYDVIRGEFLVNQGTGADFILGPKI